MTLGEINSGENCVIKEIKLEDEEIKTFLFSLGCYSGENISVISQGKNSCIVMIKDARYNLDKNIANSILV